MDGELSFDHQRQLVRTLLYLHQQLDRAAENLPLTMSQYYLLHFLHEEPRRPSDFTVFSKLRKPGVTAVVDRLTAQGWIERTDDPADGRAKIIRITTAGHAVFADFEAALQTSLENFLGTDVVGDINSLIDPFYQTWNRRRVERFNNWKQRKRKTS